MREGFPARKAFAKWGYRDKMKFISKSTGREWYLGRCRRCKDIKPLNGKRTYVCLDCWICTNPYIIKHTRDLKEDYEAQKALVNSWELK